MTQSRASQISLDDTPYYHCIGRCVRRAFLCGQDNVSGISYEHRRAWEHIQRVNQRLRGLSSPLAHAALQAPRSASRRRALKALLLLGVGSACGLALQPHNPLPPLLADYRSPLGQRRQMRLDDSSVLHLNTASAAAVVPPTANVAAPDRKPRRSTRPWT